MAAAWEQLGDPRAVSRSSGGWRWRSPSSTRSCAGACEPMAPGRLVQFLGPAQTRMRTSPRTLRARLAAEGLPASFSSAPFRRSCARRARRAARPRRRRCRAARRRAARQRSCPPSARPPARRRSSPTGWSQQVNRLPRTAIGAHLALPRPPSAVRVYVGRFPAAARSAPRPPFALQRELKPSWSRSSTRSRRRRARFYARVSGRRRLVPPPVAPGDRVLSRRRSRSRCTSRCATSRPSCCSPASATIVPDTVTLLHSNPRFIEAYMVGLNHELAASCCGASSRATCADATSAASGTRAASRRADRPAAADPHLGPGRRRSARASASGDEQLVLLIRGELLQRYPDALIYAVKAKTAEALGDEEQLPLFRGRIDPDITFLGFDLTETAARGAASDPGWFFVIQEQPTAPRFGLDEDRSHAAGHVERPGVDRHSRRRPARTCRCRRRTPPVSEPGRRRLGLQRRAHGRRSCASARCGSPSTRDSCLPPT